MRSFSLKFKKLIINIILSITSLIIFFGIGEIACRAIYPEFKNHIFTPSMTMGKVFHKGEIFNIDQRIPSKSYVSSISNKKPVILLFGDSVTFGYGLAYEDIYWNYWKRIMRLNGNDTQIIKIGTYGYNFIDNIDNIQKTINTIQNNGIIRDKIIYQFNLNDIIPYTKQDLLNYKHMEENRVEILIILYCFQAFFHLNILMHLELIYALFRLHFQNKIFQPIFQI